MEGEKKVQAWKHAANGAKVVAAFNVLGGYWVGQYTGHPVDPWALFQVSLWFYVFFSPVDATLVIKAVRETIQIAKGTP